MAKDMLMNIRMKVVAGGETCGMQNIERSIISEWKVKKETKT